MDELFVLMSERGSLGSVQEQSIEMSGVQDPLPLPGLRFCTPNYDFVRFLTPDGSASAYQHLRQRLFATRA
jgi:hypothetical protein